MSKLMPGDPTELSHIRGVGEGFSNRFGKTIIELITQAQAKKPEALPDIKTRQKLSASENALLDAMTAIVGLCAEENKLHPSSPVARLSKPFFEVTMSVNYCMVGANRSLVIPCCHSWREKSRSVSRIKN